MFKKQFDFGPFNILPLIPGLIGELSNMSKFFVVLMFLLGFVGFSSVANAELYVQWLSAYNKNLDCSSNCKTNPVIPYPMFASADNNNKPITICAAKNHKKEWVVGNNRWGQKTCTIAVRDKVFHRKKYYCLCHNDRGIQSLN